MNKDELFATIEKILNLLDNNYSKYSGKKITSDKVYTFMNDLKSLFENGIEVDLSKSVKFIKKSYIPLLSLLIKIEKNQNYKIDYLKMLENAYRLGAKDDLECFLIYYEWDSNDKVYEKRVKILKSYVYYLNKMAHDRTFRLVVANLPSGYGKTRIVKLYEAWRLGLEPNETILSLCSNDTVVKGGSRSVIDIIKNERYGQVFPQLDYKSLGKDLFLKETDGEWKLKQCSMLASYYASTCNANVVGQRASLSIHIDDLYANSTEALDEKLNKKYIDDYNTVWTERYKKGMTPQVIVTGTMWSPTDFITKLIEQEKKDYLFYVHPKFKYTYISEDKKRVIIQVPALDPETNESSCPELASTEELLRKKRNLDPYLWETNYQQNPTTPEGLEFDYKKLKTYDRKPKNEYSASYAVIDGTRKSGKDFFAMPIFQDYFDNYALIDCIFTKVATSELIDDIVDKIVKNHIVRIVYESNVDEDLGRLLQEKFKIRNIDFCELVPNYHFMPKATRIDIEKGRLKNRIWFPSRDIQEPNSDMYKLMQNFTLYNSQGRNKNDDAPDSVAMFSKMFIQDACTPQEITVFKRLF